MTSILDLKGLNVRYGAVEAVRGIDLTIKQGEIVVLLGANGAGKSSTMNAVVGLEPVAGGTVMFDGRDITRQSAEASAASGLTLSPEGRRVFGTLSVEDNLTMGAYSRKDAGGIQDAKERVYDLFPILLERRRQYAGTLSGGQQQMLAIGRALMCEPKLLLLDEPSLGLAPMIVEQVFDLIAKLRGQGVTIFLVEQNVAGALKIADRAYLMATGEIVQSGTAAEMLTSGEMTKNFMGVH